MNSSTSIRKIIFIVAFAMMAGTVVAEDAPGQRYIVILKSRSGPPPDVARLGGRVTFRQDEEVIVTLPSSALSTLKADPLVRYVQTLDGSDTGTAPLAGGPVEPTAGTPGKLTPHALAGNLSWSRQYTYDPSGNITNIGNQQFVYDSLGRLTEMATSGNTTESYVYDRYGNQTSRTTSSGTQAMDVTATTNRLSSGYGYDPAGNVTSGDGYTLSYDALGQAATKSYTATTTFNETYVYSADEERIGVQTSNSAESSSWWYWSVRDESGKVLRQYKTSANDPTQPALWIEDYVWRDGLLLGAERPAILGGRRHFHLDHLGSPRLITSDAGQIVSSHDYLPFGGESSSVYQETGDGFDREDPMKFTGHERDYAGGFGREDGHAIDYMHARYESPTLGRFLAVDPVEGDPRNPQSWNRYSYVLSSPIDRVDPDGRADKVPQLDNIQLVLVDHNDHSGLFGPQQRMDGIEARARAGDPAAKAIVADNQGIEAGALGPLDLVVFGGSLRAAKAAQPVLRFASEELLREHFEKHGAEFGFKTATQYLRAAARFVASSGERGTLSFTRANGDRIIYRIASNEFAVATRANIIRTYFLPTSGAAYYAGQLYRTMSQVLSGLP